MSTFFVLALWIIGTIAAAAEEEPGRLVAVRIQNRSDFVHAAISRDGKSVAFADETGLNVFSVPDGKLSTIVNAHLSFQSQCIGLAFAPDGKSIGCAYRDAYVILDVATGRELRRLNTKAEPLGMTFVFAADGKSVWCFPFDEPRIKLWEPEKGEERVAIRLDDRQQLANVKKDGTGADVLILKRTGQPEIPFHVQEVKFADNTVKTLHSGKFDSRPGSELWFDVSPDRRQVLVVGGSAALYAVGRPEPVMVWPVRNRYSGFRCGGFTADGGAVWLTQSISVLDGSGESKLVGELTLHSTARPYRTLKNLACHPDQIVNAVAAPDRDTVATVGHAQVKVWSLKKILAAK